MIVRYYLRGVSIEYDGEIWYVDYLIDDTYEESSPYSYIEISDWEKTKII